MIGSGDLTRLYEACRILFGREITCSLPVLDYLRPEGVRTAYRCRARETHPDLTGGGSHDDFLRVREAYELLSRFVERRTESGRALYVSAEEPMPCGSLRRPLLFGRFLHRKGIITFAELIQAVAWQKSITPRFGQLARQHFGVDQSTVFHLLSLSEPIPFGERAVRLNVLNREQVQRLLSLQQRQKKRLGEFFVINGMLGRDEIVRLVREQRIYNATCG